ncbi:hypothetical protein [Colwellia sp. E2M01]|uniref:hypothetical protein n=1 Tax=Colwellia sp. E2M01 TaxID=2841561 RepID=UPI001C0A1CE7|nr:hypothetical protein [Colwellia sp. E2M01]MBU2870940.1 hypothetical protein [Colwellia sp. E2M01]
MAIRHCNLCERKVEAKREIGVGSLLLVLLTGGLWLIALIFYGERCSICKGNSLSNEKGQATYSIGHFMLGLLVLLFVINLIIM